MRKISVLIGTAILSASMSIVAFAGEWKHEPTGWWYQNDDKSYPVSCWKEIDGKQYYFDEKGWLLMNTTTPDGKQVDINGALIQPAETKSQAQSTEPTVSSTWTAEQEAEVQRKIEEQIANQPKSENGVVAIDPTQDFNSGASQWDWD